MNHEAAAANQAAERYLLGEMSPSEQDAFEEHYFGCVECAEDVRATSAFIANAKSVLKDAPTAVVAGPREVAPPVHKGGWLAWLRPAFAGPVFAVAFLVIAGYQSFYVIPALKTPRAISAAVLRSETRGAAIVVEAERNAPVLLTMDVNAPDSVREYAVEAQSESGANPLRLTAQAPAAGQPLDVYVPPGNLAQGLYTLTVRAAGGPQAGPEFGRYRFEVRFR